MARVTFVGEVTMILDFFGIPIVTKDVTHQPHALKLLAKVRALGIDVAAMSEQCRHHWFSGFFHSPISNEGR
jgi:hypothetical protein